MDNWHVVYSASNNTATEAITSFLNSDVVHNSVEILWNLASLDVFIWFELLLLLRHTSETIVSMAQSKEQKKQHLFTAHNLKYLCSYLFAE